MILLLGTLFAIGLVAAPAAAGPLPVHRTALCLPVETPELTRSTDVSALADGIAPAADKVTCQLAGKRGLKVTAEVVAGGLWVNCWAVNATDTVVATPVAPAKLMVIPKVIGGMTVALDANGAATVEATAEVKDQAGVTSKYKVKVEHAAGSTSFTITPVP
ncbi:hypothetical protein [Virgisporangium aliadipatigenens]|nr:hypothetical protein [Virgisporangium aliadipatigenens]